MRPAPPRAQHLRCRSPWTAALSLPGAVHHVLTMSNLWSCSALGDGRNRAQDCHPFPTWSSAHILTMSDLRSCSAPGDVLNCRARICRTAGGSPNKWASSARIREQRPAYPSVHSIQCFPFNARMQVSLSSPFRLSRFPPICFARASDFRSRPVC